MRKRTYVKGAVIHIGDKISVTVLSVKGGVVRLGVLAPEDLPIQEEERLDKGHRHALKSN